MQSQWNIEEAKKGGSDLLSQRAYSYRLLAESEASITVFTSLKAASTNIFGEENTLLWVTHGGDFLPFSSDRLAKLSQLDALSLEDQSTQLMLSAERPLDQAPAVDILVHAAIPARFVDQTRSSFTLALANHTNAETLVNEIFGNRVRLAPAATAGFERAKSIRVILDNHDVSQLEGILIRGVGLLTFNDDAKLCYEQTANLNSEAIRYFESKGVSPASDGAETIDLLELAELRQIVSNHNGQASIAIHNGSAAALAFSKSDFAATFASVTNGEHQSSLSPFGHIEHVASPRFGLFSFGPNKSTAIDLANKARQTSDAYRLASASGGWEDVVDNSPARGLSSQGVLQGKIALVSGSAAGIGLATATTLAEAGACVVGADINPEIESIMEGIGGLGIPVDLTQESQIEALIERIVGEYGGLDIVVSNAGIFTAGAYLEEMEQTNWERSIAVNLTSHQVLLKHAIPFVKKGIDPTIIFIGSRNVNAPGAGAASYSCAKAALTQLCRVAALELAPEGVRVNIIHPDAVFDTKLWTKEALERSAERYGITVEQYKKRNLMKTEITSRSVGNTVVAVASHAFAKTTGAQIPVDGGNDRII